MANDTKEYKAVYGPLSVNLGEENDRKPKESIVLFLSALGGKLSVLVNIVTIFKMIDLKTDYHVIT